MTDRLKGFAVTLDKSLREDDAEATLQAISRIKGVISVAPILDDFNDSMNREVVKYELRAKIFEVLK